MSAEQLGDREDAEAVRAYLASVRLMRGCCWCEDEEVHHGWALIERLAVVLELGGAEQGLSASEAADVVSFLHSVEPSGGAVAAAIVLSGT